MFGKLIEAKAEKYGLLPQLVAAIIVQESGGDPDAERFELKFFLMRVLPLPRSRLAGHVPSETTPTLTTEKAARSRSYGLMQVMGDRARILGYQGRWLQRVADPETNLELGCKFLRQLLDRNRGEIRAALLGYNGGGNKRYPDEVLGHIGSEACRQVMKE